MTLLRTVTTGADGEEVYDEQEVTRLRDALADQVVARHQMLGLPLSRELEAALRTVPRHLFLPGVPLAEAYANDSVVTKRSDRDIDISAVSAPTTIATMLAQAGDLHGRNTLEIGSGGYNAALMSELVGEHGSVTTMDIDSEIVDRARVCLDRAGYPMVRTVCADGEFGAPEFAPFDVVIVTVGAWDIPPAWVEQLTEGGLLVVPLRTRGSTRSWALARTGNCLTSRSQAMCGFVPMQGAGEHRGRSVSLHPDGVGLWLDEDTPVDTDPLDGVVATPRAQAWSGVQASKGEPTADLDLWLLTRPGFCLLSAKPAALDQGVVAPSWRWGTPTLVDGASLAYRGRPRPVDETNTVFEFGAYGHGPHAAALAERLAEQIRLWDRHHRYGPGPRLIVYPAGTPDADLPDGVVLDKRHTRLVLSWPTAAQHENPTTS